MCVQSMGEVGTLLQACFTRSFRLSTRGLLINYDLPSQQKCPPFVYILLHLVPYFICLPNMDFDFFSGQGLEEQHVRFIRFLIDTESVIQSISPIQTDF